MWGPAWIGVRWNSIWLRARSHMTSHYMSLEVCWDGLWALSFGLSQFHGHGSWLVCDVALNSYGGVKPSSRGFVTREKVALFFVHSTVSCQVLLKPPLLLPLVLRHRHHSNPGSHSKRGLALWYKTFSMQGGYSSALFVCVFVWTSDCRSRQVDRRTGQCTDFASLKWRNFSSSNLAISSIAFDRANLINYVWIWCRERHHHLDLEWSLRALNSLQKCATNFLHFALKHEQGGLQSLTLAQWGSLTAWPLVPPSFLATAGFWDIFEVWRHAPPSPFITRIAHIPTVA